MENNEISCSPREERGLHRIKISKFTCAVDGLQSSREAQIASTSSIGIVPDGLLLQSP